MNCHALSLRAGQTGRLRFSISPEGDYALAGAVHAQGADVPLTADGDDLLIPPLPVGLHLVEVRANGRTVLYGGLEALPSPLEGVAGEACWSINADLAESVANISVSLAEGLPGPQGDPGPQGEPGEDGASAYEAWLAAGNSGSEADFLASLRPTPGELAQAAEGALYEFAPVERSTPEGTANATCQYIELDAQHVPQGHLESISLRCRTGNNPASRSYLALWELGEDGATWSYLGSSANAPGQAMNTTKTWEFGEGIALSGRKLRILAQAARSDAWEAGPQLGMRTNATPAGDETKCYNAGTGYAFLPELSIAVRQAVPKFAPAAHVEDAAAHVSLQERAWLAGLRSGSADGAVPALRLKGTQGNVLLVARGNQTNATVTGNELSFNVPKFLVSSGCPAIYSYNSGTGETKVWFAGAPDAASLAPLGIAEAGTHVGAPSLPLCLRGSELRFNGVAVPAVVDGAPTAGSPHAVSSGGVCDALLRLFRGDGAQSVAIGENKSAVGDESIAIGQCASADGAQSVAIGRDATAGTSGSVAIGHFAKNYDVGCIALNGTGAPGYTSTQLFLIPAGSDLSATYLDGEAGLGYVVHSSAASLDYGISHAGCRKLSELLTDHISDFTPTGFHW